MDTSHTLERVNRLMIMLIRDLYNNGEIDTAVLVSGMSIKTVTFIGTASLNYIDDVLLNISVSLFIPRFGEEEFLTLISLPNTLKPAYAAIANHNTY